LVGGTLALKSTGITDNEEVKVYEEIFDDKCKMKSFCRTVQKRQST